MERGGRRKDRQIGDSSGLCSHGSQISQGMCFFKTVSVKTCFPWYWMKKKKYDQHLSKNRSQSQRCNFLCTVMYCTALSQMYFGITMLALEECQVGHKSKCWNKRFSHYHYLLVLMESGGKFCSFQNFPGASHTNPPSLLAPFVFSNDSLENYLTLPLLNAPLSLQLCQ